MPAMTAMQSSDVSVEGQFVGTDQTKDIAGLLVQQIKVEILVGEPTGLVFQKRHFLGQTGTFVFEDLGLGLNLHALEKTEIALNAGKGEIEPKRKERRKCDDCPERWSSFWICHACLRFRSLQERVRPHCHS